MKNAHRFVWLACMLVLASGPAVFAQQQQQSSGQQNGKPVMVGRIALTEGQVLRYVYDDKDWVATIKDTPFGAEDSLYSDQDGKAEILVPNNTWIRIGGDTQIQGIALEDDLTEVDVASGMTRFYNRGGNTIMKATTPFGYVVAPADSRFDLYVGDESVEVIALKGTVDFIHAKNEARYEVASGASSLIANNREVTSGDGNVDANWDDWNISRDSVWAKRVEVKGDSYEYLPPQLRDDAYELEENGRWERVQYEGEYRNLWRPASVDPGWSPYSHGRWFDYYGDQCWVPYEPFGYMTHHYGNWVYASNYWYWAPPVVRVGVSVGPTWGLGFGWYPGRVSWLYSDAYVGWVPLAPFEPYYSHRYWGPASFAVASINLPGVSINIGGLHWLNHGVFINHGDFYRGHGLMGYHGVRITNINRTTIINNYNASPLINNRVIRNFDTTRARFNVTDARVLNKPHNSVTERITRNQQLAAQLRSERLEGNRVLRDARAVRQGQLATNRLERPRLTNRLVPADQVDRPASELKMQQRELVRQERSQKASEQRLQLQEQRQQRLQDRQNLREQRQGGAATQSDRLIRPERPQRERLDQLRQQREDLRQQRLDTGTQGQQQRLSPQERRQQQLDQRQQQQDQRRLREDTGTQTQQQQRLSPQDRRQQLMDQRQQQLDQRRRMREPQSQDLRQQDSGSQLDRRQQLEQRRQQQMLDRQQMREQQGGRQQMDRRQELQDRRQQQMQDRRLQMEQNRQQQMQDQRQQQMQDRRQQLQDQRQQQLQQRQQQQQQRKNRPEEQNPRGVVVQ